jgi:hypothetical protein
VITHVDAVVCLYRYHSNDPMYMCLPRLAKFLAINGSYTRGDRTGMDAIMPHIWRDIGCLGYDGGQVWIQFKVLQWSLWDAQKSKSGSLG